jgi:hypothetical protein
LPDAGDECLAAEIVAGEIFLFLELPFDHRLRGDPRMVDPRHLEHVKPAHAVLADQNVL